MTIASGSIRITGDVSDVSAKINTVNKSIKGLGDTATKAGTQTNSAFDKMGSGGGLSKTERLTNQLKNTIERATAAANAGAKGTADYYRALGNTRGANMRVLEPYLKSLDEVQVKAEAAKRAQEEYNRTTASAKGLFGQISTAAKGMVAAMGVREVIQMADGYTKFTSQLKLATTSVDEYNRAYSDVKRISTEAQADLSATGILYARISNGTRELGISQQKVADITESVNLALKVSGATAEEAASATLQLSQAFASGVLRGEEFNAVNEAAPRLMKALADGMGVSVGALRGLAQEGAITSKVMSEALPQALEQLRGEADQTKNIAGAFTLLKNEVFELIGSTAKASGFTSAVSTGLGFIADNLKVVLGLAASFGSAKLLVSIYNLTSGLQSMATAATFLRGAMSFLTGPVGILTGVFGTLIAAYSYYSSESSTAESSTERLTSKVDALTSSIETLTHAQAAQAAQKLMPSYKKALDELMKYTTEVEYLQIQIATYPKNSMIAKWNEELITAKGNMDTAKSEVDALAQRMNLLKEHAEGAATALTGIQPPVGMDKWDDFVRTLEEARDSIGMNARELGEYKAEQKGANDIQREMAGIVSAEAEEFKNLQTAIQNKQVDAANAAIENIRNLDLERQRVALLAQQMQAIMAAARAFAAGNVSADVQAGVYASINAGFAEAANSLSVSDATERQIARIKTNTKPGGTRRTGGGGGGKRGRSAGGASERDLAGDYVKQLNEQIALLGKQTEYEKALASIQLGKYGALTEAQREDILSKSKVLDLLKETEEINEKYKDFIDDITGSAALEAHLEQVGFLKRAWEEGRISSEDYQKYLEQVTEDFGKKSGEMSEFAKQASANIQDMLGSTLSDMLKGDFDDIAKNWSNMILDMVAQAAAANLNEALFGKSGGGIGNLFGGLFGGGFDSSGMVSLGSAGSTGAYGFGHVKFSSGGYTGQGGKYEPAGIVHKGEVVFSQDDVRRLGGVGRVEALRLRGYSSGGVVGGSPSLGGGVQVNIINNSSQPVNATTNPRFDGKQMVIDVVLDDLSRNGQIAQTMKQMQVA